MKTGPGIVYLVGAGPGDPGLITVRGLDLISRADVIVHDRIIGYELLADARADAEIEAEGEREGGRDGGNAVGQSVYTRDPDGNLLEFIRYS